MENQKNLEVSKNLNNKASSITCKGGDYYKRIETIKETLKKFDQNKSEDKFQKIILDLTDSVDTKEKIDLVLKSIDISEQQKTVEHYETELKKELPNIIKYLGKYDNSDKTLTKKAYEKFLKDSKVEYLYKFIEASIVLEKMKEEYSDNDLLDSNKTGKNIIAIQDTLEDIKDSIELNFIKHKNHIEDISSNN